MRVYGRTYRYSFKYENETHGCIFQSIINAHTLSVTIYVMMGKIAFGMQGSDHRE